jgi:hypothetical protein
MKTILAAILLIGSLTSPGFAQQRQNQQQRQQRLRPDVTTPAPPRQRPNAPIQDVVLGFYISQFQQVAEVNDEVFAKILPFLREFVQSRFEISARRTRSLNQLRQAINRGSAEEELKRLIGELDRADSDNQTNQERFLARVDPLLNTQQQAKVRIFQAMSDQRIRQMLDRIQNPGQNQQQQAVPQD